MRKWIKYDNQYKLLNLDHVMTFEIVKHTPYKGQTSGYVEKMYTICALTIFDRVEEIVRYMDERSAHDMLSAIYTFIVNDEYYLII